MESLMDPAAPLTAVPVPDGLAGCAVVANRLRELGFLPRPVAQALGIIAWNGRDMDGPWWRRRNLAEGPLRDLVALFISGEALRTERAHRLLPPEAWSVGLVEDDGLGESLATGTLAPLGGDLVWTDRGDRAFTDDLGLFVSDSTTLAIRRCMPSGPCRYHLDLGSGGGGVTVCAAATALRTVALDLNPRGGAFVHRSAALSGRAGVEAWTGDMLLAPALGRPDRLSFVLPLLVPWNGMPGGPVHTIAQSQDLLLSLLQMLPRLLDDRGVAVLYCQDWVGGGGLGDAVEQAFGDRQVRGLYWHDHRGQSPVGPLRAGMLILVADQGRGWREAACQAPDLGNDDWWTLAVEQLPPG